MDINQHLLGGPQSCYQLQLNIYCQIADSLLQFFFQILTPTIMMIIFGLLIVRNVRRKHMRVDIGQQTNTIALSIEKHRPLHEGEYLRRKSTITIEFNRTTQKRDAQLITMLLIQVIYFIISSFPISVYKFYAIATFHDPRSSLQRSIENTIFILCVLSLFSNNCVNFYIYTLSGAVFRKEFIKLFRFN
ncbi:hypothetical protein I4U23_005856 [Adineta vaga]|nr:hypothetical protein I4U23_005856 [Adineta vaga]